MKHEEVLGIICKTEITEEVMHRHKNLLLTNKETGEVSWNRDLLERFSCIMLHGIMKELEDMVYR